MWGAYHRYRRGRAAYLPIAMGLLSQVVNAVEDATGTQGSTAGDWTEEQAATIEATVDTASAAAAEGATDALAFVVLVGDHMAQGVGRWVTGESGGSGLQLPGRPDLGRLCTLVRDVVRMGGDRVEGRVADKLGNAIVDEAKQGVAAVARTPAGVFAEVKAGVDSATETVLVKLFGATLGAAPGGSSPQRTMTQLATSADDAHRTLLAELRRALQIIEISQPGGRRAPVPPQLQRTYFRLIDGLELRRLSAKLLARAAGGAPPPNREAVRHLQQAAMAGARSALRHAELLIWLASLRRTATGKRLAARISRTASRPA